MGRRWAVMSQEDREHAEIEETPKQKPQAKTLAPTKRWSASKAQSRSHPRQTGLLKSTSE